MPFNSELNSELESQQVGFFSDTIFALKQTIEGLSGLAGIEGLDAVAGKLQEAVEECSKILYGEDE